MKHIVSLLLLALAIGSCTKKKDGDYKITGDYFAVGRTGGFTNGSPTTYYLIANGELRSDNTVSVITPPDDISKFKFNTKLSQSRYYEARTLPGLVPAELYNRNNEHIGAPFVDAGYTDVRMRVNGISYRWYIEGDQSGSSVAVRQFIDSLQVVFR